jgi:hypothetical protein
LRKERVGLGLDKDVGAHHREALPGEPEIQTPAVVLEEGEGQWHDPAEGYRGRRGVDAKQPGEVVADQGVDDEGAAEDHALAGLQGHPRYLVGLFGAFEVLQDRLADHVLIPPQCTPTVRPYPPAGP